MAEVARFRHEDDQYAGGKHAEHGAESSRERDTDRVGDETDSQRSDRVPAVADQSPETEKLAGAARRREVGPERHHRSGAEPIRETDQETDEQEFDIAGGQRDEPHPETEQQERRYRCCLAAPTVHDPAGWPEESHVDQSRKTDDLADRSSAQPECIGAVERDRYLTGLPQHLAEELRGAGARQRSPAQPKDVADRCERGVMARCRIADRLEGGSSDRERDERDEGGDHDSPLESQNRPDPAAERWSEEPTDAVDAAEEGDSATALLDRDDRREVGVTRKAPERDADASDETEEDEQRGSVPASTTPSVARA